MKVGDLITIETIVREGGDKKDGSRLRKMYRKAKVLGLYKHFFLAEILKHGKTVYRECFPYSGNGMDYKIV